MPGAGRRRGASTSSRASPASPRRLPPQVAPYHLRLDWLMWFLPLSPRYGGDWFVPFLGRLLENDRPTLRLLRRNPFPEAPPIYVRARLFRYRFTTWRERRATGAWWDRELVGGRTCGRSRLRRPSRRGGASMTPSGEPSRSTRSSSAAGRTAWRRRSTLARERPIGDGARGRRHGRRRLRSAELTLPGFVHDVCSAIHPFGRTSPFFVGADLGAHGLRWIEPPLRSGTHSTTAPRSWSARDVDATAAGLGRRRRCLPAALRPARATAGRPPAGPPRAVPRAALADRRRCGWRGSACRDPVGDQRGAPVPRRPRRGRCSPASRRTRSCR